MKSERREGQSAVPHPQPLSLPREQRRHGDVEEDDADAARAWLRHVEARRIGS